ncbi:MAG TPA: lipid A biosynthesis acyltransferase [Puia sp.]|nr:lipid A biosynthesis acyltransferase [Puia sp.]
MPQWQGKSRGNKTGFRIFVWVLKHAGVRPAYLLLRIVAFYFFIFSGKAFRFQFDFFRKRLEYSWLRSILSIYKNYYWFGQTIIDKIVLMSGMKNPFRFDFEGEEYLRQMVSMNKGGLLLSAHVGNWEIAGHLLNRLGTDMHIVMYDGEAQKIKDYLASVTEKHSAHIILIREDLSHIYAIQEALNKNAFVCMHADRFLEGNKILNADFLNKPARFPAGPFLLARTFQVPVSFVFAMKDNETDYHFYAGVPKIYTGDRESSIEEMLQNYSQCMENCVRKYPLQWYNYYDFWALQAESPKPKA